MAYTVEKLLSDAAMLVSRLKDHDATADTLISHSQILYKRVDAMKEYQDDITELNEIAKHRPRSTLVIGIAQENKQIRELQQENRELRLALEEHQSALELIMQKYRDQVNKLVQANKFEKALAKEPNQAQDIEKLLDKICEMASVMQKAALVDDDASARDSEKLTQLQVENKGLRELLEVCSTTRLKIVNNGEKESKSCQTDSEDTQEISESENAEKQELEEDEKMNTIRYVKKGKKDDTTQ